MYVVGVDGSERSEAALRWAVRAAARYADEVVAVRAWPGVAPRLRISHEGRERAAAERSALAASVSRALAAMPGVRTPATLLVEGDPAAELARVAMSSEPAMLVLGRSGLNGFEATLLGSVPRQCVSRASWPVVVVPADEPAPLRGRVVAGVTEEGHALHALEWAAAEAASRHATLVAVHAYDGLVLADPALEGLYEHELTHRLVDKAVTAAGVSVEVEHVAVEDEPARALLEAAAGADLLVVGARTHGVLAKVLPTTAIRCAERSPVPVAVIPSA